MPQIGGDSRSSKLKSYDTNTSELDNAVLVRTRGLSPIVAMRSTTGEPLGGGGSLYVKGVAMDLVRRMVTGRRSGSRQRRREEKGHQLSPRQS